MKYYAVKKGLQPGIYTDWNTAKTQIYKFKGAIYKSFESLEEAQKFINDDLSTKDDLSVKNVDDYDIICYTDGSCKNKIGGYGIVIIMDNTIKTYKGKVPVASTNNIAELYGVYNCLNKIKDVKDKRIVIKTDSEYSIKVILGYVDIIANKDLIQNIKNLYIMFDACKLEHVYGHKDNEYNILADKLANEGRMDL